MIFIGVIGPNGGGKTTLLKGILGLLKPVEGTIKFGTNLERKHQSIGYLPQVKTHRPENSRSLFFDVVRSGAIMQRKLIKHSAPEIQRANELLEEMGIQSIKNKAIGELSGGADATGIFYAVH